MKKNEMLIQITIWMNLANMLSKRSQEARHRRTNIVSLNCILKMANVENFMLFLSYFFIIKKLVRGKKVFKGLSIGVRQTWVWNPTFATYWVYDLG